VKGKLINQPALIKSAAGAALAVLCGVLLWATPSGDPWVNASYDYLFRFGTHSITNPVTLILMDNEAFDQFHQTRGQPWDRNLHAQLLNRLADDGCALVVMDSFFHELHDPATDAALANAMRRQRHIVLMAEQAEVDHPNLAGALPALPASLFLDAAGTNWGVAWLDPDLDSIVRRQWPFPSPGPYPSLPWTAARLTGAKLDSAPRERWLRYYSQNGPWTQMSYSFALTQPKNYFRNRIVFIGTQPKTSRPDGEQDKFSTPYTRRTHEASGGVEILVTAFLNLVNDDWLERPGAAVELPVLVLAGVWLGGGMCRLRPWRAAGVAAVAFLVTSLGGILAGQLTNYWFPWLVIAGGQVPCALICAWALPKIFAKPVDSKPVHAGKPPSTPGYALIYPPFGEGSYGKVWLARAASGKWHALKIVYRASFGENPDPYDREFDGVTRYQRISGQHPGLLRVDFVSKKYTDYFYYVMELGDSVDPDWESDPPSYRPRDLFSERTQRHARRLPVRECVRIGLALTDALDFIHRNGLTHRDIKPQNIIFVDGQPKLADLGLIAEIRPLDQVKTYVGTPGYMPPPPELPGTPQADIYALGMVLYVLCTGKAAAHFPEVATTLVDTQGPGDFLPLNNVILKACQPVLTERYATVAEMRIALQSLPKPKDEGW